MTIYEALRNLSGKLKSIYDDDESVNIATWVVEFVTGFDKTLLAQSKSITISDEHEEKIHSILNRLLKHEPVQYVLEEAWFYGMKFFVNEYVLIPRPETEELVDLVIKENRHRNSILKILDIGTGSGCIPVTIKKKIASAEVWAVDISEEALKVAAYNAKQKEVEINFLEMDFLDKKTWPSLPDFDIIVSNPPYVRMNERSTMRINITEFEPATALFVPDDDPLIFYKSIAEFGKSNLVSGGKIYCEINESLSDQTLEIFIGAGWSCEIVNDLQGKSRMLRVIPRGQPL